MAMKLLLKVTLDAKQIREACVEWAEARTGITEASTFAAIGIADDMVVTVEVRKAQAPRKSKTNGNAVASAGPLSEAERRFA